MTLARGLWKQVRVATAIILVLIACTTCGSPLPPSSAAVGDWEGRVAPAHFDYLHIRFAQRGNSLQGTACYTTDVHLTFSNVPAEVDYPRVYLSAPGFMFVGKFQADGRISGSYARPSSYPVSSYPLMLTRALGGYPLICTTP